MSTIISVEISDELATRYNNLPTEACRTVANYMERALEEVIDLLEDDLKMLEDLEDYKQGRTTAYTLEESREHCGLNA